MLSSSTRGFRIFQTVLVMSCLCASMAAAEGEVRLERVTLSVKEPRRKVHTEGVRTGAAWVLPLRVVDPGRLVVKAGEQVIAECYLGWGEDERLRVGPLREDSPPALPRVVNREVGREMVEVDIPAEVGAGGPLTLTYEWEWKYRGQPTLVRTWPLLPPEEEELSPEQAGFERDYPLVTEEAAPPEPEPAGTLEEEPAWFAVRKGPLPFQVDAAQPELLWVPADASREEIASRLLGDASAVGAFDFEPWAVPPASEGVPKVAVIVRTPEALRPEVLEALRRAMDAQLGADAAWARAKLQEKHLGEHDSQALVEMGLRWAQRSGIAGSRGQSYFDQYLSLLFSPGNAADWSPLGEEAEKLQKGTALRSKQWKTGYTVTDASPQLAPGNVIGRCYFNSGAPSTRSSLPLLVAATLVDERSLARAEVQARNLPWLGMRALIPGADGRFRVYAVTYTSLSEDDPFEGPESRCYGYYPGTLFIRPG